MVSTGIETIESTGMFVHGDSTIMLSCAAMVSTTVVRFLRLLSVTRLSISLVKAESVSEI